MTPHRSVHTLLGTLTATAALVALVAPPASARIIERDSFHDEFSGTNDNFCDAGIAVDFEATVDGRYDTTGAVRSVETIVGALPWRRAAPVLEVLGDPTDEQLGAAYELGATLAALLIDS